MPSKLALVSVVTPHIGPWQRVDGSEYGVQVMGNACDVVLEYKDTRSNNQILELNTTSTQPFPVQATQYRAVCRDSGTIPVTVSIHFN